MAGRGRVLTLVYNDIRRDARVARMSAAVAEQRPVTVLSVAPRGSSPPEASFRVVELPLDHTGRWARSKHVVYWVWAVARGLGVRCSVVHCHDVFPLPAAAALAWLKRVPLVYDAHELVDHREPETSLFGRFWNAWHRWAIRRADRVITPTEERARFLADRGYGPRRAPVSIMNVSPPPDRGVRRPSRAELGIPDSDYVVVYQGYVAEKRYTTSLVEAFAQLPGDHRLLLIGDGPGSAGAAAAVRRLRLEDRVMLTGYLPKSDVLDYLAVADAGVMMYDGRILNNYYCAPNKIFDYLHWRLPVVGNDLPPIRSLLSGYGVGALLTGRPTPEGIAAAIGEVRAMDIPPSRFEEALRQFDWSLEAGRLREVFAEWS